ncbi:MAG: aminotransferase class V-fold PLP-dependent enzyme [Solirubrobacteraceae bacterium]
MDGFEPAFAAFLDEYPAFIETAHIDELRRCEYGRLATGGHVYLDHTGGGLYAACQVREHALMLEHEVLGNPHSLNPTSSTATALIERARERVLSYFGASTDEYEVIFTPNATGALRLVGEAYPFGPGDQLLLLSDNHNSVNGIREFASARGAETTYVPCVAPELRVDDHFLRLCLTEPARGRNRLLAYPAQSNFTGVQHPLEWIQAAQSHGWDVVVDCAAFAPTNRIDLQAVKPDFVPISFYKLFGYPTGIGCLIARRSTLAKLDRPWFAGGTILAVSVQEHWHRPAAGHAAFEDGTVNYLSLPAVEIGLDWIDRVGLDSINTRVRALGSWLLDQLCSLRHPTGVPAVVVYGPATWNQRGATIALNFLDATGRVVDERLVDRLARNYRISLRTGCFCNPGAGEAAFGIGAGMVTKARLGAPDMTIDDYIEAVGLPSGGAVRVSLGLPSNFADAYRFMQFARSFLELEEWHFDLPPRQSC